MKTQTAKNKKYITEVIAQKDLRTIQIAMNNNNTFTQYLLLHLLNFQCTPHVRPSPQRYIWGILKSFYRSNALSDAQLNSVKKRTKCAAKNYYNYKSNVCPMYVKTIFVQCTYLMQLHETCFLFYYCGML